MVERNVRITGLKELQAKCKFNVLVEPEMKDARETITKRIERGGKGLGAERNELSTKAKGLGATVTTTLIYPRTTGRSWGRKNTAVVTAMGPRVIRKSVQRIEARWREKHGGGAE